MSSNRLDAAHLRVASFNKAVRDRQTMDMFEAARPRQRDLFARKRPTPAWLVHRQGLSDTPRTPDKERARHKVLAQQAERSFWKWHEECQKRKQRREVMVAKGLTPGKGKSGKKPHQRKPASRLRCP